MDLKQIKKIIQLFEESKVNELELEDGNLKIRLAKQHPTVSPVMFSDCITNTIAEPIITNNKLTDVAPNESFIAIKSPVVGTYYAANSPTAQPFVTIGKKVKKGEVLCLVEAMKILNELRSDVTGVVKEICVKNGELIQYDQPLMYIEEAND